MKKTYFIIIAALFCLTAKAQTPKADRLFSQWEYLRAANLYEKETVRNPGPDVYYKLGECYRKMNRYNEEMAAFDKVNAAGIYRIPEFYLNYGLILKTKGKFDQAKMAFDKYTELMPSDPKGKFYSESLAMITEDHKWDEPVAMNNVAILNSANSDFSPVLYKDGIVFTSSRKTPGHGRIYGWTGTNYLDMYYAKKGNSDSTFTDVAPFGDKNSNKKFHDGPACFSADFKTIYISRVEKYLEGDAKKSLKIERNKIFISTITDDKWSKAVPFVLNSDSFSVSNPFLTANGSRIYFVSDMPGGYGETDIYYCNLEGDKWSSPINMGANINSFNREKFPNMDADGNFYFASDGYQGFGSLDICVALNKNGIFQKAKPMKYPFNTGADDYGILFLKDGKTGYISSNRYEGGKGDDDILYFDLQKEKIDTNLVTSLYTMGYRPNAYFNSKVQFQVNSPKNIPLERRVRETFPIRNYIFFDLESTEIPDRYVLLDKKQVKDFKEDQLEVFIPKNLSGRSKRQMTAYYNILNILGDRMGKNPKSKITLVGSSEKGPEDGKLMAESVKKYLVSVFGINYTRIGIEGRNKPKIPSEHEGNTQQLELLRAGDRRVSIESDAEALLMEFQSGPDAPLKPVELIDLQEAPLDSYVSFSTNGGKDTVLTWFMEISDEKGSKLNFGPYTYDWVALPGKSILGTRPEGNFKVSMIGQTQSGLTVKKDTTVHMVLWVPSVREEGMRYSVIFEYNDSKSIDIYEKYLQEIVSPKIPKDAMLIIHGHTDLIGTPDHNKKLSWARSNDVKEIFKSALLKAGRSDVKIEVYGFGEDLSFAPFENKLPEERFYNRTVIIDIVPNKSNIQALE